MTKQSKPWSRILFLLFVFLLFLSFTMPLLIGLSDKNLPDSLSIRIEMNSMQWSFIGSILIFAILLLVFGKLYDKSNCHWGIIIDPVKGIVSLSRIQLVMWTILVVAGLNTLLTFRFLGNTDTNSVMDIVLHSQLLIQLGISVSAAVLAPSIEVLAAEKEKLAELSSGCPKFFDVFKGILTSDNDRLDLIRVQQFLFTFIVLLTYIYSTLQVFGVAIDNDRKFVADRLPELSDSILILIGISNGAYLVNKAIKISYLANKVDS